MAKSNAIKFKAALVKAIKDKTALTNAELTHLLSDLAEIHNCTFTRAPNGNREIIVSNPIDLKTKLVMGYEKTTIVDICQDSNIREKVAEAGAIIKIARVKNKNAYIHYCQNGRVFVSYATPIAVYLDNARMLSLHRDCFEFSATTSKHVSDFKAIMGYPDVQFVKGA